MTSKLNEFALPLISVAAVGRPSSDIGNQDVGSFEMSPNSAECDDTISFAADVNTPQAVEQPCEPQCSISVSADKITFGGGSSADNLMQTFDITFNVYCSTPSPTGSAVYDSECYTVVKRIAIDKQKLLAQAREQASNAATMLENKKLKEALDTKKRFRVLAGLE